MLYLRVEDIRAAYDGLRARGVEFLDAPHMIHRHNDGTEELMAHFNDPEGRPLAILAQVRTWIRCCQQPARYRGVGAGAAVAGAAVAGG